MPPPGTNSQGEAAPAISPLFRPEVLAAQASGQGEILLIRPLSLTFLVWLGILLGAALLGILFLGKITETVAVSGTVLEHYMPGREAAFGVPASLASSIPPGTLLAVRCTGCTDPGQRFASRVLKVGSPAQGSDVQVQVALPPPLSALLNTSPASAQSAGLEAEIPLGRTSLIHWLLKPSPR